MLKTVCLIVLTLAIIAGSFLSQYSIPAKYQINPLQYCKRWGNYLSTFPMLEEPEKVEIVSPGVEKSFDTAFTPWENYEISSVLEIPSAISVFMNNLITKVREFFKTATLCIPTLFHNIKVFFNNIFDPVRSVFINLWNRIKSVFVVREWWNCLPYVIVPIDWQEAAFDNAIDPSEINMIVGADKVDFDSYIGNNWRGGR